MLELEELIQYQTRALKYIDLCTIFDIYPSVILPIGISLTLQLAMTATLQEEEVQIHWKASCLSA